MHRLFAPEPLKRQCNCRLAGFLARFDEAAPNAAMGTANAARQNYESFQYLDSTAAEARNLRHAALMLRHDRSMDLAATRGARLASAPSTPAVVAQVFIDSKNSELFLVLRSLSSRKSIASM